MLRPNHKDAFTHFPMKMLSIFFTVLTQTVYINLPLYLHFPGTHVSQKTGSSLQGHTPNDQLYLSLSCSRLKFAVLMRLVFVLQEMSLLFLRACHLCHNKRCTRDEVYQYHHHYTDSYGNCSGTCSIRLTVDILIFLNFM